MSSVAAQVDAVDPIAARAWRTAEDRAADKFVDPVTVSKSLRLWHDNNGWFCQVLGRRPLPGRFGPQITRVEMEFIVAYYELAAAALAGGNGSGGGG